MQADWILVPREPTEAMMKEGARVLKAGVGWSGASQGVARDVYQAMCRVAPAARGAAPIVGEANIDALCKAYEDTHKHGPADHWKREECGAWSSVAPLHDRRRNEDRARMRAFLAHPVMQAALPSGGGAREAAHVPLESLWADFGTWFAEEYPTVTDSGVRTDIWRGYYKGRCDQLAVTKHIPSAPAWLTDAATDVIAERKRQIEVEGWHTAHDDLHDGGGLAIAGACYAMRAGRVGGGSDIPKEWPWGKKWWKPKSQRRDLVRAAALILAEIERLDRLTGGQKS